VALDNFIPEVWSARLLENLHDVLVFGQDMVINGDYEGEISGAGDTVRISNIGTVTVGDYTKNTNIGDPQTLSDAQATLVIDQSKYFNFQVDDIDQAQQKPKVMNAAMREASYALARVVDTYLAGKYTEIASANTLGTFAAPIIPTVANALAYESLVDLATLLDENNTPEEGRWCIVPPWYEGLLLKDDRFVKYNPAADTIKANGTVGFVSGMRLLKSNNIVNAANATPDTVFRIMAGHSMAWTLADQINKTEAYRPEKRFGDAVKGLHLYGAKVIRPSNLALLNAVKPGT
jgi:N4-gp56 family major capsid protein